MQGKAIDNFLKNFRECLAERAITVSAFGRAVGINVRTIYRWYTDCTPKVLSVIKTADFFGCSVDYLMGKNALEFDFQPDRYTIGFWERFKELKQAAEMTDYQVAKACKVGTGTVSKWTHGRLPDLEMLARLCEVFDTSFEYLLGRVD